MGGKANLFNLGASGVDLVKSPLHMADGAWRSASNAEFNPDHAQGGIKKRGALLPLNSVALAGAVQGLVNVPLPLNTDVFLMLAMNGGETPTFKSSEDGATFANVLAAEMPRIVQNVANPGVWSIQPSQWRIASFKRALYYPGDDYVRHPDPGFTNPPLLVYTDVGTAYELIRIPPNPTDPTGAAISLTDMVAINGLIYFGTHDSGGVAPDTKGRVFSFDPSTGTLTEIGNRFGNGSGENTAGFPFCLCSYQGRLWAGTYGITGNDQGKVYNILPGIEDTWTRDLTGTLHNGYFMGMAAYKGKLYVGTSSDSSGTAIVQQRTSGGTWSTSFTAAFSGVSQFDNFIVFNHELYCYWWNGTKAHIKKYDGSSWVTDLDVGVTYAVRNSGTPFIFGGALYWPCTSASVTGGVDGFLLKRTTGGVWSRPLNGVGIRGALGKFTPDAT